MSADISQKYGMACRLVLSVGPSDRPTMSVAKMTTDIVGLCGMALIVVLCAVIVFM